LRFSSYPYYFYTSLMWVRALCYFYWQPVRKNQCF